MAAAACASRNPCRLKKAITRRRTRSVSAARSPWVSGLAGRNAGGQSGPCDPGRKTPSVTAACRWAWRLSPAPRPSSTASFTTPRSSPSKAEATACGTGSAMIQSPDPCRPKTQNRPARRPAIVGPNQPQTPMMQPIRPLRPDHAPCQQNRIRRFFCSIPPTRWPVLGADEWPVLARRMTHATQTPEEPNKVRLPGVAEGSDLDRPPVSAFSSQAPSRSRWHMLPRDRWRSCQWRTTSSGLLTPVADTIPSRTNQHY